MKNIFKLIITIALVFFTIENIQAQRLGLKDNCPDLNVSELAQFTVEFFVNPNNYHNRWSEYGVTNQSVEQIRPVSDESICAELNKIINNNTKYKQINDNLKPHNTKYFYRTNDLFYIFWTRRPEYDDVPSLGPRELFIIVSVDFQNVWEIYQ